MSYDSNFEGYSSDPMPNDIKAIQFLYDQTQTLILEMIFIGGQLFMRI